MAKTIEEQLKEIKPGKTYPRHVEIDEPAGPDGKPAKIEFRLQSYYVGMYCALHIDGRLVAQFGDHNNKMFVTKLKADIKRAIVRGAKVKIGSIRPIVSTIDQSMGRS